MNRMRTLIAALAVVATASLALAQNADKNSAGPTKNDYRLKVVEPREGATINGSTVRVVVDTRIPAELGEEKRDVNSMPRPRIDVFVDNSNKGTLEADQNVLEVPNVTAGNHKLVLMAKNQSGEIIGRQEINFVSTEAVASTSTTTESTAASTYTAPAPPPPAPAPAPAPAPSTYSAPAPSTYTAPSTSTYQAPPPAPSTARSTLPKTATSDGLVAGTGLALLIGGYALRRRQA